MKSIEITAALVVVAVASVLVSTSTVAPVALAQQGTHGSASSDFKGSPDDPNHWGDSASDFGNDGIMGSHSREGSAPGDAPFDDDGDPLTEDEKGRIGVGNNDGDGPSGHATCVDSIEGNEDNLCNPP
jgi:hypothetical protein